MALVEMLRQENNALRDALWLKGVETDELNEMLEGAREESAKHERLSGRLLGRVVTLDRRTAGLEKQVAELCRWRVDQYQEIISELEREESEEFNERLKASRHHPTL